MSRTLFVSFLVALILTSGAIASVEETTVRIIIDSPAQLPELTRLVSIYDRDGDTVRAVAFGDQLRQLRDAGYNYTVVPERKKPAAISLGTAAEVSATWDSYPVYPEYDSMMHQFETDYPNLCRTFTIGNTVLGRDLLVVKITDSPDVAEAEPEVFYTSTMHGDETAGFVLMLRLIDSLLTSYGTDSRTTRMIDSMEIWINPNANPDGTYRSDDSTLDFATRGNWNGVDLNRNFKDPDDGDHPDGNAWQPETVAMMDFAAQHHFVISANFHGGAEVVNYPWDTWFRRHADDQWLSDISRTYVDSVHHYAPAGYMDDLNNGITNGWDWYPIAGGRQDYMTYFHGCRETTIELSDTKLLPPSLLPSYWTYNRASFLTYLENALHGIRGIVTDATTDAPLAATIHVLDHDVELDSSYVYTDPDVGDYYRMLEAGTYDVAYSADGYVTDTVFNVTVTDLQATTVDVQLLSPVCGDVNNSGGQPNISDLTYLVAFMFKGGPAPPTPDLANVNGDGEINISDVTYLVSYMFRDGPGLTCP